MPTKKQPVTHALHTPAMMNDMRTKCGVSLFDKRIASHGMNNDAPTCVPCAAVVAAQREVELLKRGPVPASTEKYYEWSSAGDAGVSSRTIVQTLTGARLLGNRGPCTPSDPDDFGRCYRVLRLFPELRARLHEVADKHHAWRGLIDNWTELEALYEQELPTGSAPRLYARMLELCK